MFQEEAAAELGFEVERQQEHLVLGEGDDWPACCWVQSQWERWETFDRPRSKMYVLMLETVVLRVVVGRSVPLLSGLPKMNSSHAQTSRHPIRTQRLEITALKEL